MRGKYLAGALIALVALVAAGCGGSSNSSTSAGGSKSASSSGGGTLDVYSSLPLQGAGKNQTIAMQKGIQLALEDAGMKAGKYTIKYSSLDDSTASAGNWDPGQTAQDARKAAQDPKAIAYIGEFNSGASAISMPILNQADVPQISPTNTYVGLTTDEPGSVKGEPAKYYPTGKRHYVRIAPRDTIQGQALLTLAKEDGCTKVAVANDKDTFGAGLARIITLKAKSTGVNLVWNQGIQKDAPNFRSVAASIKATGADCFIFAGVTANGGVQVTKDVAAAIPGIKLYGPDGTCESGFTNAKDKGIPAAVAPQFQCTIATLNLASYPGGKDFLAKYKAKYGDAHPDPYAIYGYDAASLVLDTIKAGGTTKQTFIQKIFSTPHSGALGSYTFDKNGDSSLTDYGVYKVGSDGDPVFEKAIKAQAS